MPGSLFDNAGLAVVAYAHVLADGSSTPEPTDVTPREWINSGVTTTLVGSTYTITLPGSETGQQTLDEGEVNDLVFVQARVDPTSPHSFVIPIVNGAGTDTAYVKTVNLFEGEGTGYTAFDILILRSIVPNQL